MAQPGTWVSKSRRKVFPQVAAKPLSKCSKINSVVRGDLIVFLISIAGRENNS